MDDTDYWAGKADTYRHHARIAREEGDHKEADQLEERAAGRAEKLVALVDRTQGAEENPDPMDQAVIMKRLESRLGMGPTAAARFLGVRYNKYWEWSSGQRDMPTYIRRSVQAHLALSQRELQKLIRLRE